MEREGIVAIQQMAGKRVAIMYPLDASP